MKNSPWLKSLHNRLARGASRLVASKRTIRSRIAVERLEDRTVPSAVSISIADASVKEQGNLGLFVPGDAAIMEHPSGLVFGPDRNNDGVQDLYALGGSARISSFTMA